MEIADLWEAIQERRLRVSDHADEEAAAEGLSIVSVVLSIASGEKVEEYPDRWPLPGCLVLSFLQQGEPVHSVWAYNETTRWEVLVTVYGPDPSRWIDWRYRRTR